MEKYKCRYCAFTFSEAYRCWDSAIDSGRCPKCSEPLNDFPGSVRGHKAKSAVPQETKERSSQASRGEKKGDSLSWYLEVLKKYAVFDGRARREEYWYFVLFSFLVSVVLMIIDVVTGTFSPKVNMGLLTGMYTLAVLIPYIAVSVRRLHDTNRSGWWSLIVLIPLIGAIALLLFMVQDSQEGENEYGPNLKITAGASRIAATEHYSIIQQQKTRPAPVVAHGGRVNIAPPFGQQQTAVDEERIYAKIANELEAGIGDKGLWTRLFAECGGDEKQTKVSYIKERADRLIIAERLRLEQAERERTDEASRLELVDVLLKLKSGA